MTQINPAANTAQSKPLNRARTEAACSGYSPFSACLFLFISRLLTNPASVIGRLRLNKQEPVTAIVLMSPAGLASNRDGGGDA